MFGGRILDKEGFVLDLLEDALYDYFNKEVNHTITESVEDLNELNINDNFEF